MYFTLTLYISFGKSRVHSQIKINTARYSLYRDPKYHAKNGLLQD
jgi:hypothetical protein